MRDAMLRIVKRIQANNTWEFPYPAVLPTDTAETLTTYRFKVTYVFHGTTLEHNVTYVDTSKRAAKDRARRDFKTDFVGDLRSIREIRDQGC